jgi:hypothetical protein
MAHRAVITIAIALVAACGGSIERVPSATTQSQEGDDEPPVSTTTASAEAAVGDAMPSPDGGRTAPHPYGGECGACLDEQWVCCPESEPCAGKCVPDCRMAPDKCPDRTTCDEASGVCLRR